MKANGPSPDGLASTIAEIFRAVLGNPSLTIDEDFFGAGGDSLLAVDAVFQISRAVGSEVDMTLVFMYPTAESLADALAGTIQVQP